MKLNKKLLIAGALLPLLGFGTFIAHAQITAPQVQSIGNNDLFQDVVNGTPQANNYYASASLLSATWGGYGDNYLIGGDAASNLVQRSVAGAAVTGGTGATVVYTFDRWFNWQALAGSTANNSIKETTAAALGPGTTASMRFRLANSQTGTAQVCTGQVISNQNSAPLAGHTVELDFNAYPGATWTATQINTYIITGTDSSDTGSADMAFGLNANSVSATAWASQANATTGAFPMSVSTLYRGMAVANIPSTATEVGVALCFTPSGTSSSTGGTDGVDFSNIELRKADSLSNWVNATTDYNVNTTTNQVQATINGTVQNIVVPAFARKTPVTEALLQYSYYYQINEPENAGNNVGSTGNSVSTSECEIVFPFPAPMRSAPTLVGTAAIGGYNVLSATTFKIAYGTTPIVLATTPFAAFPTNGLQAGNVAGAIDFHTAASLTQYAACTLVSTASGGGAFGFNAEE